jgi:hypothetical protein
VFDSASPLPSGDVMHRSPSRVLVAASVSLLGLGLLSACNRTQLAAVWNDPTARRPAFHRTVAVFATTDETLRRSVEDRLASRFPNTVPSYRVLPGSSSADHANIVRALSDSGFDGAIVMRLVAVNEKVTYAPGTYWYASPYSFSSYWNMAWASPYDPGYASVSTIYTAETEIYDVQSEKLVFGARSETTDPATVPKLVDSIMRHINAELQKRQLLY